MKLKGREYWQFHRSRLHELGCHVEWTRVARATINEIVAEVQDPVTALRKVRAVMKEQ